jgi:sporulation protein YlmC with PRC-barrel domain
VRQPAPQVTITIPQPDITVRMPRPDVNVAQARPQVEVRQPRPEVSVVQPTERPDVTVRPSEPQVRVVEAQPRIRYERAEPRVTFTPVEGQPKVRFEEIGPQEARAAAPPAGERVERTEAQRRAYQQRFGGDAATTGSVQPAANPQTRNIRVSELDDMDVYNRKGEELGEIERVVMSTADNKRYLIVAHGGFLGLGEDRVAFPVERFAIGANNRLILQGVTEQDIEAMDNWRNRITSFRDLGQNDQVSLGVAQ